MENGKEKEGKEYMYKAGKRKYETKKKKKKEKKTGSEKGGYSSCPAVHCKLRFISSTGPTFKQLRVSRTLQTQTRKGKTGQYTK